LIVLVGGLFVLLMVPKEVHANVGPKWWGTYGSEPQGGLVDVAIQRETLKLDLRPVANLEPATVEATYHLYNSGAVKKVELVFVAGSEDVRDFAVYSGTKLLPSRALRPDEVRQRWNTMPSSWKPPPDLAGIDSRIKSSVWLSRPGSGLALLAFELEIPHGASTLRARYRAKLAGTEEGYPTATWQLHYILAPARQWGTFGRLEVTIYIPNYWQHTCSLDLENDGARLHGTFDGLPADCLTVATRLPIGPEYDWKVRLYIALDIILVIGGGLGCWWVSRRLRPQLTAWPEHFVDHSVHEKLALLGCGAAFGLVLGGLFFMAGAFGVKDLRRLVGPQESPYYGSEFIFQPMLFTALISILAVPFGIATFLIPMRARLRRSSR
jgi:hypothetical protein